MISRILGTLCIAVVASCTTVSRDMVFQSAPDTAFALVVADGMTINGSESYDFNFQRVDLQASQFLQDRFTVTFSGMGPIEGILKMLPGVNAKALKQVREADPDGKRMKHAEAIVLSMTKEERKSPEIMNGSRRARVAKGAGRPVSEVNRLLDQFKQMRQMMKKVAKGGRPPMMPFR